MSKIVFHWNAHDLLYLFKGLISRTADHAGVDANRGHGVNLSKHFKMFIWITFTLLSVADHR